MRLSFPLLVSLAVALALRLALLWTLAPYPRFELMRNQLDDQFFVDVWAKTIVAGHAFETSDVPPYFADELQQAPVFPRPPLYPYFLALVYRCVGVRYDVVRLLQLLADVATVGFIYAIAWRYFSRPAAGAAALLAALYGPFVFYSAAFLTTSLAICFAAASLFCLTRCLPPRRGMLLLSGAVLGTGVLLRAESALFAVVGIAWCVRRAPVRRTALTWLLVGLSIPLLPVIARNSLRSGRPAFVAANGPYNFFLGNVHDASGDVPAHTATYTAVKQESAGRPVDYLGAALRDIRQHPGAYLRLQLRKLRLFYSGYEIPNNLNYYLARRLNPVLRGVPLQFHMLCPLAVLGLVIAVARRAPCGLLYGFIAATTLATVLFFVVSRLRQPVVVALLVFAGVALAWWWEQWQSRRFGRLAGTVAAVVLLALWLTPRPFIRTTDYAIAAAAYYTVGQDFEALGAEAEAQQAYIRALVLNPAHRPALQHLTALRERQGLGQAAPADLPEVAARCAEARSLAAAQRYDEAVAVLRDTIARAPGSVVAYQYLSNVYFLMGDRRAAAAALEEAVALAPLNPVIRDNLRALRESPP